MGGSKSADGQPRIVLVSPIAVEDVGDPHIQQGAVRNEILARYTQVMHEVARETKVGFADVFQPTKQLFEESDERLTLNRRDGGLQPPSELAQQPDDDDHPGGGSLFI